MRNKNVRWHCSLKPYHQWGFPENAPAALRISEFDVILYLSGRRLLGNRGIQSFSSVMPNLVHQNRLLGYSCT